MEEVCGKITIRGNKCFNQKSKCRYHQVLKRKFYSPSMNSNFANRAICGVETTGNSQSGDPCQNPLQKGEEYCASHAAVLFDSKSVHVARTLAEWN